MEDTRSTPVRFYEPERGAILAAAVADGRSFTSWVRQAVREKLASADLPGPGPGHGAGAVEPNRAGEHQRETM